MPSVTWKRDQEGQGFTTIMICLAAFALQWRGRKGDTVILVGHNGAGKTTLLLQVHTSDVCTAAVHHVLLEFLS